MKTPHSRSSLLVACVARRRPPRAPTPTGARRCRAAHASSCTSRRPSTDAGEPIELEAMIDAPFAETLSVRWRPIGGRDVARRRRSSARARAAGSRACPPPSSPGVEYYIRGNDAAGAEIDHFASAAAPHVVRVDPALVRSARDARSRAPRRPRATRSRSTSSRTTSATATSIDAIGSSAASSSTRTGCCASSTRSALASARSRAARRASDGDGDDVLKGMRYGFGQVRLRVHPSVFLDGRVGLGVEPRRLRRQRRAAQITFGKPWRSNVQVGGEYIGDLGRPGWVRLQWDTAPPLLMGASIVRTDLPGAIIDVAGLYIAYDIAYRVAERVHREGAAVVRRARWRGALRRRPRHRRRVLAGHDFIAFEIMCESGVVMYTRLRSRWM